jgi:hypothetical protein
MRFAVFWAQSNQSRQAFDCRLQMAALVVNETGEKQRSHIVAISRQTPSANRLGTRDVSAVIGLPSAG